MAESQVTQSENSSEQRTKQVLVTGGGGFLGRYIVEQLLSRGDNVRVFSRSDYPELRAMGVEVFQGDLQNKTDVEKACINQDVVFHVAALPGVWGSFKKYYAVNVLGTENVLSGCLKSGVQKLIYTSSPSVVFDGTSHENANERLPYPEKYLTHYPHTKATAEKRVLESNGVQGLMTCALRPHLIWGPRDNHLIPRLLEKAKSGRLRRVGDGSNVVSMSYVENVAAAHLQAEVALCKNSPVCGEAYFINEKNGVNLWDWIDEILKQNGLPAIKKSISAKAAWRIGAVMEFFYTMLPFLSGEPPMTRFVALQLSQSHSYDVGKAERDFGYSPIVEVDEGMCRMGAYRQKE